jgi:hydrogenase maturation protease
VSAGRRLVLGLGNPLMGDDGIGAHLTRRLRAHPRLPPDTDVLECGTDLLRLSHELTGRAWVILVDALLDPSAPGALHRFDGDLAELDERAEGAHCLSPVQALRLLRCVHPALRSVPVTFLGIAVGDARISHALSPALAARLDALVEEVIGLLHAPVGVAAGPQAATPRSADPR